jgi:hypothetical protein
MSSLDDTPRLSVELASMTVSCTARHLACAATDGLMQLRHLECLRSRRCIRLSPRLELCRSYLAGDLSFRLMDASFGMCVLTLVPCPLPRSTSPLLLLLPLRWLDVPDPVHESMLCLFSLVHCAFDDCCALLLTQVWIGRMCML